jgi:hypothetical protein
MKRSGFLKALGVMIAAPSVVRAIPTEASATTEKKIVKSFGGAYKMLDKRDPRGPISVLKIVEHQHGYARLHVAKGRVRRGDYYNTFYPHDAKNNVCITNVFCLPDYDDICMYVWKQGSESLEISDYIYPIWINIGESSI